MRDATWTVDDGAADAWSAERACQYGDGLFETVAVVDGRPCLWELHLARLFCGCDRLGLPRPDMAGLERACDAACRGAPSVGLKVYWTAGRSGRGYRRPKPLRPGGLLQAFDWRPPDVAETWRLRLCGHRLSENPALAGIKHLNRLDQVIARAEWDGHEADEGVMLGQAGHVVCGTMSNLFVARGGRLSTPEIDGSGVAGVVRRLLLDEAQRQGSPIEVKRLEFGDLLNADAVYMTNALIGVRRVARLSDTDFDLDTGEHPLMAWARQAAHAPGTD